VSQFPVNFNPFSVRLLLLPHPDRALAQIDQVVVDSDYREPVGGKQYGSEGGTGVYREYTAQISYRRTELRMRGETGEVLSSDGHLVFKASDLKVLDATLFPRRGDRIVAIKDRYDADWRTVDYTIIHVVQKGHFRTASRITFAYFEHRRERQEAV